MKITVRSIRIHMTAFIGVFADWLSQDLGRQVYVSHLNSAIFILFPTQTDELTTVKSHINPNDTPLEVA